MFAAVASSAFTRAVTRPHSARHRTAEGGTITYRTTEWQRSVLDPVEAAYRAVEERDESDAVATLLPTRRANAGLTDGWQDVLAALRALSRHVVLPDDEAVTLAEVAARIEMALRNR